MYFGTVNASATEIPPRNAAQVNIGIALFSNELFLFKTIIGSETEINLAKRTITIAMRSELKSLACRGEWNGDETAIALCNRGAVYDIDDDLCRCLRR